MGSFEDVDPSRYRKERLDKSPEAISEELRDGKTPLIILLEEFADTACAETFDALYARLSPDMQEAVKRFGGNNILVFDKVIEETRERGLYLEGWMAYRDWTRRQPWAAQAEAEDRARLARDAARPPSYYAELGVRLRQQGALLGQLKVLRMRATDGAERDELTARIERLEKEFEEMNFGDDPRQDDDGSRRPASGSEG